MGDEKALQDEIVADAQKRADRVRSRAEREAQGVIAQARREADADRQAIAERAEARAETEHHRIEARTEQDLTAQRLGAVQAAVEHVRALAMSRLGELPGAEGYGAVLVELAVRAVEGMEGSEFALLLAAADGERWSKRLPKMIEEAARERLSRDVSIRLADEGLHARGGLVVRSADGRQVADQTFDARAARLRDQIAQEVVQMLPPLRTEDEP